MFEQFYSPLTSAILNPFPGDAQLPQQKLTALDQLYVGIKTALDRLADHVGLQVAAYREHNSLHNENKILVWWPITDLSLRYAGTD